MRGALKQQVCRLSWDTPVPRKITPCKEHHYKLIYREGDITDGDCAMFTDDKRKKVGFYPACWRDNTFSPESKRITSQKNIILVCLDVIKVISAREATLAWLYCSGVWVTKSYCVHVAAAVVWTWIAPSASVKTNSLPGSEFPLLLLFSFVWSLASWYSKPETGNTSLCCQVIII